MINILTQIVFLTHFSISYQICSRRHVRPTVASQDDVAKGSVGSAADVRTVSATPGDADRLNRIPGVNFINPFFLRH